MLLKLVLYLISSLLLTSCQSFFYYPTHQQYITPKELGLKYDDIHFHSTDGACLHGWLLPHTTPGESKGTVVFFHGNAENLSSHFLRLAWLVSYGYDLFVFDYQGYGQSPGSPSTKGSVEDGIAAIRWGHDHNNSDQKKLIVYGNSLGGIVSMSSIQRSKTPVDYFVLEATFDSYQNIAFDRLKSVWLTWPLSPLAYLLTSDEWAPDSSTIKVPALIIHGTHDQVIPFSFGEEIYQKWSAPKCFWKVEGANHGSIYGLHPQNRKKLIEYLEGQHGC